MKPQLVSIVRHTHNYDAMLGFYRDSLGMDIKQAWNEPNNRGTVLWFDETKSNAAIEVVELWQEAVPGGKPVNLVLSIEIDKVDEWN
jgi:hypothetical protein